MYVALVELPPNYKMDVYTTTALDPDQVRRARLLALLPRWPSPRARLLCSPLPCACLQRAAAVRLPAPHCASHPLVARRCLLPTRPPRSHLSAPSLCAYSPRLVGTLQPLHRPGHASPAVWLRPKGGGAQHVGWQPLRWAVGLVDGLLTDVSQMGPLIATQAKARRERAFPMTVHTVARRISWRQSSATDKEDLAWLRKMLAGKEDAVDATLRARMGVSQLPPLLVSRELSAEPILSQYLQALRRSQLRRLAVACVHRPSAERCLQLAMALPPCLEEISLFKINGGALVPVLCKLFMRPGPAAAGGASGAAGSATAGKSAPAAPARPPSSFPPVPGATVAMPRLVEVAGPGGGAGPPVTSGTHQTGERLERLERLKQPSRNWDSLSNNGMPYNGLTRVTMRSCALTDTEGIAIASALEHNDTLKVLVLRDAEFGDKTAGALAAMLAQNSTLQTLKLPRSLIGDEGAASFGSALERNGALTTLSLNSTFVGEAGAIALARGLAVNAVLRTLNLRQNGRIGDKGVVALGAALAQNGRSALRELDLNGCGVGDDGARSLGDALAARRADGLGLTSLVLIKNCIGERGAHELASALRAHAAGADSLVKLQVHSQRPDLPESAKAALKEAWAHGKRTDNAAAKLELENPVVTPSVIKIVGRPPRHKFTPKFNHA